MGNILDDGMYSVCCDDDEEALEEPKEESEKKENPDPKKKGQNNEPVKKYPDREQRYYDILVSAFCRIFRFRAHSMKEVNDLIRESIQFHNCPFVWDHTLYLSYKRKGNNEKENIDPIVQFRLIEHQDIPGRLRVAVVSEAAREKAWKRHTELIAHSSHFFVAEVVQKLYFLKQDGTIGARFAAGAVVRSKRVQNSFKKVRNILDNLFRSNGESILLDIRQALSKNESEKRKN